jgi:D-alanyl-D-alanine carboxypeptidase (penicillin-binding protein 5/6)
LAILARALIEDYPDFYKQWYGVKWYEFNKIKQANRNKLLWKDASVDGLKTGFTGGAGFCLVASAQRNNMRLISVVMGSPSGKIRMDGTESLINWGFHSYSTHQLFPKDQPLAESRIWFGKEKIIPMGLAQNLYVTIPNGQYQNLKAFLVLDEDLKAPIRKGQTYGRVEVTLNNQTLLSQPLVALQDNPEGNLFERGYDHIIKLFET